MPPPFIFIFKIMKYLSKYSSLALVICLSLVSCKSNQKDKIDETYIRPASVEFTAKDTSSIDSLVKMFVQYANNGDLSNASSMLHVVEKGKIAELPVEKRQKFEIIMTKFPFHGCEENSIHLEGEKDNKIGIFFKISPNADVRTGSGCIKLVLNPVRIDNVWYLTLRDEDAEGIQHMDDQY